MEQKDLLAAVRTALESNVGELRKVAAESGIPYDTVLRIKNREGDPGYSKVRVLGDYFGLTSTKRRKTAKA